MLNSWYCNNQCYLFIFEHKRQRERLRCSLSQKKKWLSVCDNLWFILLFAFVRWNIKYQHPDFIVLCIMTITVSIDINVKCTRCDIQRQVEKEILWRRPVHYVFIFNISTINLLTLLSLKFFNNPFTIFYHVFTVLMFYF